MDDGGIYLVSRALGLPGPTKTLITGAYNNRDITLTNLNTAMILREVTAWANTWGHFNFVQDDNIYYIASYEHLKRYNFFIYPHCYGLGYGCVVNPGGGCWDGWGEGMRCGYMCYPCTGYTGPYCWYHHYAIDDTHPLKPRVSTSGYANYKLQRANKVDCFTFGTPAESGTIEKVTVWAEVRGIAKLRLNDTYGSDTPEHRQFTWECLEYSTVPGGSAWTWPDVAGGTLTAGVYLYWGEDASGCCRRLKVVITTTTGEITLWPAGDSSILALLVAGNYLEDLDLCDALAATESIDLPVYGAVRTATAHANKYLTSDLSEVAPSFSLIDGITVTYAYRASTPSTSSYARAYLEIAGTKYYGTTHQLGSIYELLEYTETWATNPATGLTWDYDDYKTARFGVHVYSAADLSYTYIFKLMATTEFRERKIEALYSKIRAEFDSCEDSIQNPLTANSLIFFADHPIPERVDVAYFQHGQVKFLGFVWSYSGSCGRYKITAKSYIAALEFRMLPDISYSPKTDRLDGVLTLEQILSADPPTHPLHSHLGKLTNMDGAAYTFLSTTPDQVAPVWAEGIASNIILTHESLCGILFIANSIIPVSNGDSTGKVPQLGPLAAGRILIGLDEMLAQIQAEYNLYVTETATAYYWTYSGEFAEPGIYGAGAPCNGAWGSTSYSAGFQVAGLRRLAKHTGTTCTDEQYYQAADGSLYVAPWPGSQLILMDGAMDCFVDIDYNELSSWTLNEEVQFSGKAKGALDNIFSLAGLEVTATPKLDGRIHLDARLANGRGSAAEPLRKFYSKVNCEIEVRIPTEPLPSAVIGFATTERMSCDWQISGIPLLDIVETDRTGDDLQGYLDAIRDDDETEYTIRTDSNQESTLRPYDWIWVDDIPARVRRVVEYPMATIITAGKKPFNLTEKWGQWKGDRLQGDHSQAVAKKEFTGDSSTFVVKAKNYRRGDWICRLTMAWDITTDGTEIEATTSPKATVTLQSRKIGVYLLPGKSGSITIDISDACSKSISTDTTNTISIALVDHLTGAAVYHTVTKTVEQYRAAAVLETA